MSDNTLRPLGDGRVSPTRPAVTGSTAQAAPPARQQLRQATDRLYTGGSFTAPVGQPALGGGLPSSWLQDLARLQDLQLPKEDRQRLQMRIKGALLDSAHPAFAQQLAQAMSDRIHDSPHSSDPLQGILKRAAEENPALKEAWLNSPLTKGRRDYLAQNFARLGDNDPKVRAEAVKNLADVRLMPPGARQSAYEVAADQIAATTSDNPTGNATMDWLKDQKNVAAQQATIRGRTGQAVTDLNHHESATRRRGQKFLGDLLESDVPEVRRRAADALVESARGQNGSYSKQFLSERNTPETTEALSTLIGSKMDWTLRGTLQKRGAAGAEALSRRYSQATDAQGRQAVAAYLKDQPGLGEALKNGQSPDLAANLGRTLREEEKDFWSGDPRLKALGGTDSPAARAALIDAAGHPRSGKYAGEVLAETEAGRKQALEGFGSSQDPQQQANLAKAALHEQNLTTPAGRAAVLAGLRSEHAALRNATLGATQFRGGQWADDPKFGQEVAREGLKLLRSEDPTERSKALQLLDTTLRGTKMDPAFKSQAYGELRNLAKNAQDPTEARRLDWAADSLSTTFNHYGQKSFEDGVLSGDPARVAKSFEFVKPDAIGLLESRLGAEKPPRKLETVLGELRGKDPKQYQQVLDNLARYSSDDQHPHDSGKVLQTQLKGADAATVQEFARRNLHEPGGYQTPVRGAIDALAAADTPATLQALAGANGGRHAYQVNEGLRSVVADPQRSASSRQTAADALSRAKPDALSAEARAGLVGYAASSRDPALKARALEKVPAPPLTDARLQKVGETYSQLMAEELKKDPLSPGMSSLKQLLRARSLHEHEDYRGKVNVGAIDRDLGELAGRSPLKDELEAIRQRALKDVLGRDPGAAQRAYLTGDDIQQRLKLMSPEDAKKHVEGEMKKLAAVDPQSAKTVSEQFAKKSAEANALKLLAQADPKAVETSLAEALRVETQRDPALERDLKVDAVKLAHEGSQAHGAAQEHERKKIAKQIRDALEHVDRGADASTGASQLASILSKVQPGETPEDAALRLKALRFTEHMQKNGRIGSLFFGVGLASNLASGIEHPELLAQQTAGILNVAGDASEVAKLFNLGKVRQHGEGLKEFGKLTNMGKVVKVLEFAGPVGDAVGMGFDINSALDNFKAGDTFGASMNIAGAVGGGASVVAGICIAAGASGPAAPIVLVAGTVIGLLAWGADSLWGESEEESFLRRGVKIDGRERNYWLG